MKMLILFSRVWCHKEEHRGYVYDFTEREAVIRDAAGVRSYTPSSASLSRIEELEAKGKALSKEFINDFDTGERLPAGTV